MVVSREDIPRNDHLSVFHPRNFPVVEVVKGGHFAVAGIVDRGQTHEGTGEEAAVRLVHVVVGEDPRVEPDRQFGPGLTVERVFVGVPLGAHLGTQPYAIDALAFSRKNEV